MPATILVVEDNADLLLLYKTAIEQQGHQIVEARSGAELMRLLKTDGFAPDLVVLDIEMPDSLNLNAVQYIRNEPRLKNARILVVTANESYRDKIGGAVEKYIVKPIAITTLLQLVDELTRR